MVPYRSQHEQWHEIASCSGLARDGDLLHRFFILESLNIFFIKYFSSFCYNAPFLIQGNNFPCNLYSLLLRSLYFYPTNGEGILLQIQLLIVKILHRKNFTFVQENWQLLREYLRICYSSVSPGPREHRSVY